jgi:hypothetical protein
LPFQKRIHCDEISRRRPPRPGGCPRGATRTGYEGALAFFQSALWIRLAAW